MCESKKKEDRKRSTYLRFGNGKISNGRKIDTRCAKIATESITATSTVPKRSKKKVRKVAKTCLKFCHRKKKMKNENSANKFRSKSSMCRKRIKENMSSHSLLH